MSRVLALVAAIALFARPAAAFTQSEETRLAQHDTVVHLVEHLVERGRYVGGLAYRIVDADAGLLSRIVRDPRYYRSLFARCESAEIMRIDPSGRAHVRFVHALGPFRGGYTASIACRDRGTYCSFELDADPQDAAGDRALEGGWGYIRLTSLPSKQTLVTYGVLFDLGDGLVRSLFETRIRRAALDFPRRLANAAAR